MRPALSIVFFTVLSGAGYGLLIWLGLAVSLERTHEAEWRVAAVVALVLITVGLLSSLVHLGQPQRAWRALSQWRTSWLSREGIMALVTYVPAIVLIVLATKSGAMLEIAGAVMALLALGTVICTAMIYASLKPIPAWRHWLVVPSFLILCLLSGAAFFGALMPAELPGGRFVFIALMLLAVLAKGTYWARMGEIALPSDRAAAVGLPGRVAKVFEAPHTEANYITREMVFKVARRYSGLLRVLAIVLLAGVPLALMGLGLSLFATAGSILAGVFVERWLFFAEARHVVTLYY